MSNSFLIDRFDKPTTEKILKEIQDLKLQPASSRTITLVIDSASGDYQNSIKIADAVLRNGVKMEVICSGTLDSSVAIICALANCTGGKVTASAGTNFRISLKISNSGKVSEFSNSNILDREISKILKHLKCNMKLLDEIIKNGSIMTVDVAKRCRLISEIEKLPPVKAVAKKASIAKTATPEAKDDSSKTGSITDDSKKETKEVQTSEAVDSEKKQ